MNEEEIINAAKMCGFELFTEVNVLGTKAPLFLTSVPSLTSLIWVYVKEAERREREACANIAEFHQPRCEVCLGSVADKIWARGEK